MKENTTQKNKTILIAIYFTISLFLFIVEFTELNLFALLYYVFALLNLYNAVRLANKLNPKCGRS